MFFVVVAVAVVVVVIAYCNRPYLYRLSTQTNTSKIIQSAALTWECNSYLLSSFFALSLSQYTHLVAFFRLIFCVYWIFFSCVILYISKTDFEADFTVHNSICCHRSFSRALCDGYIDFFGGCLLKCSSICLHTFVDCTDIWIRVWFCVWWRKRKENMPTDDWRIENKQMTAINIENQSNDIRYNGIHLKFHLKLAPWSAFASYRFVFDPPWRESKQYTLYWTFCASESTWCEHEKKDSFPHHWFFDYTLQMLETICCWLISCSVVSAAQHSAAKEHIHSNNDENTIDSWWWWWCWRVIYIFINFVIGNEKITPFLMYTIIAFCMSSSFKNSNIKEHHE